MLNGYCIQVFMEEKTRLHAHAMCATLTVRETCFVETKSLKERALPDTKAKELRISNGDSET